MGRDLGREPAFGTFVGLENGAQRQYWCQNRYVTERDGITLLFRMRCDLDRAVT